jgi:hypothetical protein
LTQSLLGPSKTPICPLMTLPYGSAWERTEGQNKKIKKVHGTVLEFHQCIQKILFHPEFDIASTAIKPKSQIPGMW